MFFRTTKPLSLAGKNLTSTYESLQLTTAISLTPLVWTQPKLNWH